MKDSISSQSMDGQGNEAIHAKPTRRICLFAGYSPDGRIHDYVLYYVSQLAELSDVHYFADCDLNDGELEKLAPYVRSAVGFRHEEYDFGSWQRLIESIGWSSIMAYDELVICNDSCYGPIFPLGEVFGKMGSEKVDFWGMTESPELLTTHLQSYFLVFGSRILNSDILRFFFSGVRRQREYWNYVVKYELAITRMLANEGYKFASYLQVETEINATTFPMTLVRDFRFPFIKIKSFTTPETNLNEPIDGLELLLEQRTSYDVSMIRAHLEVVAPNFESRIVRRLDGVPTPPNPAKPVRILIHLHLEHLEETPYFISKLIHIRAEFDLYVTVLRIESLAAAQISSFDERATIIELPNGCDDVVAFLHVIELADLQNYEYVLKLHSMGIRFDQGKLEDCDLYAYGWRNTLVEALLESEAVFHRHLAGMKGNLKKGMTASSQLLSAEMREATEEKKSLVEAWTQEMSLRPAAESSPIVIGRMFLMRASLCSPLLSLDYRKIESARSEGWLAAETLEHAFEKIFALLLDHGNATVGRPDIRTGPDPAKPSAVHSSAVSRRPGKLLHHLQFRYLQLGKWIGIYDKEQHKRLRQMLKLEMQKPDESPP